ncbi:MAG: hypothetical protein IKQ29_02720 [Bacilli bacterium]|nr:hypothetical protein [Bacilli bacterium]
MEKLTIEGSLEHIILKLWNLKREGKSAYCDYKGRTISTDELLPDLYDSLDKIFMSVYNVTYYEYITIRERKLSESLKTEWLERGHKLISPELWSEWEKYIDNSIDGIYRGKEIEHILRAMEAHMEGIPTEDISNMIDSFGISSNMSGLYVSIIKHFYIHGTQLIDELRDYYTTSNQSHVLML